MKSFRRDGKFGKKDFKRPGQGGFKQPVGRKFREGGFEKQLFDATCDNCGGSCQVPFKPSGDKPVYCRDCYRAMEGGETARGKPFGKREHSFPKRQGHFGRDRSPDAGKTEHLGKELEMINIKLDKILRALEER